ncbi:MAG: phospholipid carrier-dependent glycosyltransferase [Alphaproteobacteria bacterium]|nr:phospholipid carrier-dependent glycosyltransferase [Alphaproteobacteria bacterium]
MLSGVRPYVLLGILCFLLYAPGLAAIPPLDRDEARFAQATRQMLETGDFIRIRFQDEARNKKPIGIYWLQAAAVASFSSPESAAIWPYRLPSALAGAGAVLLTFAFGASLLGSRPAGFLAALLTGSALGVVTEAHLATTDAALLAAVVAGQGALGLVYAAARSGRSVSRSVPLVFWLAEAAAILLKGPPGPVLALLTVVALSIADRDVRWVCGLRPRTGLLLTGLVVAPWFIAIEGATGGQFISDSVSRDLLPKLVGAQEAHGAPPGYYSALVFATFWPGSLFIVPALLWGWRWRRALAARFLLAWLVPGWLLLEFVPTKLPHYVLPLYPALALLAGGALSEGIARGFTGWARLFDGAVKLLWAGATLAFAVALIALPRWFGGEISAYVMAAALASLGAAVLLLRHRGPPMKVAGLTALLAGGIVLPAALEVVPGLDGLWLSRSARLLLMRHRPGPGEAVLSVGYSEPSLVFLLGTKTRLVTAAPSADQLAGAGMGLVNDRFSAEFRQSLASHGLTMRAIESVRGLDYSAGGEKLVLTLYRLERG